MKTSIEGRRALITGAGSGIGRAVAQRLSELGCDVVLVGRTGATLNETAALCPGATKTVTCDLTDESSILALVGYIRATGGLDILVNNAGIVKDGLLMAMKEEDFSKVVDVNLKGTFHCIRHAARQMIRQRSGRIVNMASVVGIQGNAGQANYAASKAGIIGLTKAAARELAGRGITVNAVAPGFIETDMTAALSEKVRAGAMEHIPLGSFGQPEDVAEAVAFLASEKAGYITGQVLSVDGGMAM